MGRRRPSDRPVRHAGCRLPAEPLRIRIDLTRPLQATGSEPSVIPGRLPRHTRTVTQTRSSISRVARCCQSRCGRRRARPPVKVRIRLARSLDLLVSAGPQVSCRRLRGSRSKSQTIPCYPCPVLRPTDRHPSPSRPRCRRAPRDAPRQSRLPTWRLRCATGKSSPTASPPLGRARLPGRRSPTLRLIIVLLRK